MQLKKTAIPMILAGVFAGPVGAQAPIEDINDPGRRAEGSNASMQAELYRQLQQLRQEVMSLRGTVEQQGHQLRQLKQQSLDRYLDVDRRLSAMSGTAPSSPLGSSSDDPAAMAKPPRRIAQWLLRPVLASARRHLPARLMPANLTTHLVLRPRPP